MNELEQRLADELDAVADHVPAPDLAVAGLMAAGRRERVRRRSATAGLVAATVALTALVGTLGLPGGQDRSVDPATPRERGLSRPLELAWWEGTHTQLVTGGVTQESGRPGDGVLHVDGAEIAVAAEGLLEAQGRTLVHRREDGHDLWSLAAGGRLEPFAVDPVGDPVVGRGGDVAWLEEAVFDSTDDVRRYVLHRLPVAGEISKVTLDGLVPCCDASARPQLLGVLPDGRVLLNRTGSPEVFVWDITLGADLDTEAPVRVDGVPAGTELGRPTPWPGGLALGTDGRVVLGQVDRAGRFRVAWETPGDGTGVWSDDGEQYAEVTDAGIRVATEAGATVIPLTDDDRAVVGWESDTEVVVAQWIEVDGAVTRVWRCSVTELRCAEVADAPNGLALLPGLESDG